MKDLVPEKYQTLDDYVIPAWQKSFLRKKLKRKLYKKIKKCLPLLDISLLEDDEQFIIDNSFLHVSNIDVLAEEYNVDVFNSQEILKILEGLGIFELAETFYIVNEIENIFPAAFTLKQITMFEDFKAEFIALEKTVENLYKCKNLKKYFLKYKKAMEYKISIFYHYCYTLFADENL